MVSVMFYLLYAECHYAECRYGVCRYAESRSALNCFLMIKALTPSLSECV